MSGVNTNRVFRPVPDFPKDESGKPLLFKSPLDNLEATAQRSREDFIAIEHLKILRDRLTRCYREEGVNHYENCKGVAKEYYDLVHTPAHGALYTKQS